MKPSMKGCSVPTARVAGGSAISITLKRAPGPIRPADWRACGSSLKTRTCSRINSALATSVQLSRGPKASAKAARTSALTPNSRRWIGAKCSAGSWMFSTSTST